MEWRVKIHRQSIDNPMYFSEPFTKWMAWMDLLLTTSFKDWIIVVRGNVIEIKRWQNWYSEETLAERRKWSRNKVRRYLNYLETIQQIEQQKSKVKSIITIINYNKYQWNDTTDDTTERHQTIQQTDTNKKDKKKKEWKEEKKEKRERKNLGFSEAIELLIDTYNEWRKKKLQELTDHWLELWRKNLIKLWWDEEWIKLVLEQSIQNGWEWIFELKNKVKLTELTWVDIWKIRNNRLHPKGKELIEKYKLTEKYTESQLKQFETDYFTSYIPK